MTEELLRRRRPFTALMAFDDMTAFGAIRALGKAGIRVPEQCSVIGFDDVAPAAIYSPALTTVRQPMEVMGTAAATIVLEAINAGSRKETDPHHSPQDRSRADRARVHPQREVAFLNAPKHFLLTEASH